MASRKEILTKVQKIVPPMLESFHKGTWSSNFLYIAALC